MVFFLKISYVGYALLPKRYILGELMYKISFKNYILHHQKKLYNRDTLFS